MHLSTSPPTPNRPSPFTPPFKGRMARFYLPAMAIVGIGFGLSNWVSKTQAQQLQFLQAEEERLRKNQQLMDAYGDKDNLQDLQRAQAAYDTR